MHLLTFSSEAYQLDISKLELRVAYVVFFFFFVHLLTDAWINSLENTFLTVTFSPRIMIFINPTTAGLIATYWQERTSKLNSHLSYNAVCISGFSQLCPHSSFLLFQQTKAAGNAFAHTRPPCPEENSFLFPLQKRARRLLCRTLLLCSRWSDFTDLVNETRHFLIVDYVSRACTCTQHMLNIFQSSHVWL